MAGVGSRWVSVYLWLLARRLHWLDTVYGYIPLLCVTADGTHAGGGDRRDLDEDCELTTKEAGGVAGQTN